VSGFAAYTRATEWLYGLLTTPAIAGVAAAYEIEAPQGATAEGDVWIEYEAQAPGDDVAEVAEHRIWTEFVFLVRAVTRGRSTKALESIADEIDNRLQRASGSTSDGLVLQAARQQEYVGRELDEGIEYRSLGGFYSLIVQPA